MRSIVVDLQKARALSAHDVRLAAAAGVVATDSNRQLGLNDGLFYPPGYRKAGPSRIGLAPPSMAFAMSPVAPGKSMHTLALLVDFSDNVGTRPASDFQTLLFDPANPGSLASYYKTLSGGTLTVTGEAIGYVRAPNLYDYYTNGQSGMGNTYPKNGPGLLFDALTEFCKTDNLARFDSDGDGFVDGIFLIHAGGGAEAEPNPTKRPNMIWSHKWTLTTPFANAGVQVYAYSTEPEDGQVGVFCHEFGHVLGLPDLYDISYRSGGIGQWCLMSGGSWCGGGSTPCRMSAWCMAKLSWITPRPVTAPGTLSLDTLARDPGACHRVWTRGSTGPEYLLLENRQRSGQDAGLPGHGLAVWHIDDVQSDNTNPLDYWVALVQADGRKDLEFNRNSGDDSDLFPGSVAVTAISDTTTPSTRSNTGSPSGVSLSNISESAAGVITLNVSV
jgi:immune inhibitor A